MSFGIVNMKRVSKVEPHPNKKLRSAIVCVYIYNDTALQSTCLGWGKLNCVVGPTWMPIWGWRWRDFKDSLGPSLEKINPNSDFYHLHLSPQSLMVNIHLKRFTVDPLVQYIRIWPKFGGYMQFRVVVYLAHLDGQRMGWALLSTSLQNFILSWELPILKCMYVHIMLRQGLRVDLPFQFLEQWSQFSNYYDFIFFFMFSHEPYMAMVQQMKTMGTWALPI